MTRLLPLLFLLTPLVVPAEEPPLVEGEGVTVVARPEPPPPARVIESASVKTSSAPDVVSLLTDLGLQLSHQGGYGQVAGLSLRGMGSGRSAVLLDGLPVQSAQNGVVDLSTFLLSSVEAVEVAPGANDTRFGLSGAMGGTINLVTVRNPAPGFHWRAKASSLSYQDRLADTQQWSVGFTGAEETWAWSVDGAVNQAANAYRTPAGPVIDGGAAASLTWWGPVDVRWAGQFYSGNKDVPGLEGAPLAGTQWDQALRTSLTLAVPDIPRQLALGYRAEINQWTDGSGTSRHELQTAVASASFDTLGADADAAFLHSTSVGSRQLTSASLRWSPTWVLTPHLDAGTSAVVAFTTSGIHVLPRFGLEYRPTPTWTLAIHGSRSRKDPTLNDLYWPADAYARGNPDLKPEEAWGGDLIVRTQPLPGILVESETYGTWHQDAIVWQPQGSRWTPLNVGRATYAGSDWLVQVVSGPWTIKANYSFLLTWALTGDLTWADQRRLPYKPVHRAGALIEFKVPGMHLTLGGRWEDWRYITLANATILPSYITFDATWDQRLVEGWNLFFKASNLLDQSYTLVDGYPMPGRSLTVGLRTGS